MYITSWTNPELSNQSSVSVFAKNGISPVLTKRAIHSLKATERWNFEYVSCFSKLENTLTIRPNITLIQAVKSEAKMVRKRISHYNYVVPSLSSRVFFKNASPMLIPKAMIRTTAV